MLVVLIQWKKRVKSAVAPFLFRIYPITHSHGWIKSEAYRVVVRVEPLQQPTFRKAQEPFCKRLSALNAYISIGKVLQIKVGTSPV